MERLFKLPWLLAYIWPSTSFPSWDFTFSSFHLFQMFFSVCIGRGISYSTGYNKETPTYCPGWWSSCVVCDNSGTQVLSIFWLLPSLRCYQLLCEWSWAISCLYSSWLLKEQEFRSSKFPLHSMMCKLDPLFSRTFCQPEHLSRESWRCTV